MSKCRAYTNKDCFVSPHRCGRKLGHKGNHRCGSESTGTIGDPKKPHPCKYEWKQRTLIQQSKALNKEGEK